MAGQVTTVTMAPLTMFDACNPSKLPKLPKMIAGYIDGPCKWPGAGWSMFPTATKVRISVEANELADVFDWEQGTSPLSAVRQAIEHRAQAYLPSVVYCSLASWPTAKRNLGGLPIAWWVADWTGVEHCVAGATATQWASLADYDISAVLPSWPKSAG